MREPSKFYVISKRLLQCFLCFVKIIFLWKANHVAYQKENTEAAPEVNNYTASMYLKRGKKDNKYLFKSLRGHFFSH